MRNQEGAWRTVSITTEADIFTHIVIICTGIRALHFIWRLNLKVKLTWNEKHATDYMQCSCRSARTLNTVDTKIHHWTWTWDSSIYIYISLWQLISLRFILMLSSQFLLGLWNGLSSLISTTGLKQAKGFISGPSARRTKDLLKLNRD
jgi:hypothetical protein